MPYSIFYGFSRTTIYYVQLYMIHYLLDCNQCLAFLHACSTYDDSSHRKQFEITEEGRNVPIQSLSLVLLLALKRNYADKFLMQCKF